MALYRAWAWWTPSGGRRSRPFAARARGGGESLSGAYLNDYCVADAAQAPCQLTDACGVSLRDGRLAIAAHAEESHLM